ncbi:hypothetical protein KP509_13G000600 [Ceratopteris richardii]|nr:hypothetical protein KP509_13G000600 [Ceratopteris richardii]
MDILLQNWTYFQHAHGHDDIIKKHVHAKYCENEFGHFLLSGNQHIHGQFYVHLHFLVSELRQLLAKLQSQVVPAQYKATPIWISPKLEEPPELEIPPFPAMPKLYPIEGLLPVPSEEDECIPNDLEAPVFRSPVLEKHPPLVLPEPLKVPPLKLPIMAALLEDESSIDYGSYEEEALPVFVLPHQDPLPVWIEPTLAELPKPPEYLVPETIPLPVQEAIPSFRVPLMDPRPCEKAYYELDNNERGVCDGLCSKHGHRHHFVPGKQRKEPCFAKPPSLVPLPVAPFPGADNINVDDKDIEMLVSTDYLTEEFGNLVTLLASKDWVSALPLIPEPSFQPPQMEPLPTFEPPIVIEEPDFVPLPRPKLPSWREPDPPGPLGWLAGQRPIFLVDCGSAMLGERFAAVQKCLQELFSPGGQVEVAATHFDVIMYSFDAWSYGDIENSYVYKQTSVSRYLRPLEPMRVKDPETLEAALNWVTRWHPSGTSNLWKALTLATSRAYADCIYLFSEGKADKPVLMLEFLKQQAQTQGGQLTPIYTIGLRTSKPKARFLTRLSALTGGQFIDYDYKQSRKLEEQGRILEERADNTQDTQIQNVEEQSDDIQDMIWARAMVEEQQRRNAEIGRVESIKDILEKVEVQYEPVRLSQRLQTYEHRCIELEESYKRDIEAIRTKNAENEVQAKEQYEKLTAEVTERNHLNYEMSKLEWEKEIEVVRARNRVLVESFIKWRYEIVEARHYNEELIRKGKQQFLEDLKVVELRNASIMEKAEEEYKSEVERILKKNEDAVNDVARRQKEINEKTASINEVLKQEYESALRAVQTSNAALLRQARQSYEEHLAWVKVRNAKAIEDAQALFVKHCEEVTTENVRKKVALAQRLQDIKRRREEALAAHQLLIEKAIAEHAETAKVYSKLNSENEARARMVWKKACDKIDKRNEAAERKAKEDFELEEVYVQNENIKLAERRLALKRHISEVFKANAELEKRKKLEWKEACIAVEAQYEMDVAKAQEMHKKIVEDVKQRNAEKIQSSLIEHKAKVEAVESYNERVRPYVEMSNAVREEIRRIESFLQCIADRVLPRDRHIMEKNPSQSQFDCDLDLLQVSEVTLDTHMLIDALRHAYGKSMKVDKGIKGVGQEQLNNQHDPTESLSIIIPVSPVQAPSHNCLDMHREPLIEVKINNMHVNSIQDRAR